MTLEAAGQEWPSESVPVRTLVTIPVREEIRSRARKAGQSIGAYLHALILRELELADTSPLAAKPNPKPVVALPKIVQKPAPLPDTRAATVMELVERGFTASQIAALKRMPYRKVMEQMGREVDEAAKNFDAAASP